MDFPLTEGESEGIVCPFLMGMIIKPKIRGFFCLSSHPQGCAANVAEQIRVVQQRGLIPGMPRRVLIIGASTGYGLATRIAAAFGGRSATFGVFFEKAAGDGKTATAGWYNSVAFTAQAKAAGLYAGNANGDAFSDTLKAEVIDRLRRDWGGVDLLIYSLASPRRTDPRSGRVFSSTLKPIGQPFFAKSLDTDKRIVTTMEVEPATEEEIEGTRKVMGGEDWEWWVDSLTEAGLLAPGFQTAAYSYIGPEVTWPVYHRGTIGMAKVDLQKTARRLHDRLQTIRGRAFVSVNKAVVTQASAAIPVVPLYLAILFRIMKEKGLHEGCIEQMDRFFRQHFNRPLPPAAEEGDCQLLRLDDLEMRPEVQAEVRRRWTAIETGNLDQLADFAAYQTEFLKLFGFGLPGVDYEAGTDPEMSLPL